MTDYHFSLHHIEDNDFAALVTQLAETKHVFKVDSDISLQRIRVTTSPDISMKELMAAIYALRPKKQTVTFHADMTCMACANSLNFATSEHEKGNLKAFIPNLVTNRVIVELHKRTDSKKFIKAVSNTGLGARDFEFSPDNFSVMPIEANNENECRFYYTVTGIPNAKVARDIEDKFKIANPIINSCTVDIRNNVATVTVLRQAQRRADDEIRLENDLSLHLGRSLQSICRTHMRSDAELAEQLVKIATLQPPVKQQRAPVKPRRYFRRAKLNLYIAIPLMILSPYLPLPITQLGQGIGLLLGGLTLGVMWQTGKEFYWEAFKQILYNRKADMYTLVTLGTGSAWIYSMLLVLFPGFFPLAALQYQFAAVNMILGVINLGEGIRKLSKEQSREKVEDIEKLFMERQKHIATRVNIKPGIKNFNFSPDQYTTEDVPYTKIEVDDIILWRRNEPLPVDGKILKIPKNETFINEGTNTGEFYATTKTAGQEVHSGAVLKTPVGNLVFVRATVRGANNSLKQKLDKAVQASNTNTQISQLLDSISGYFTFFILCAAMLAAGYWGIFGTWAQMVKSGMNVFLCACPCALGMAAPISTIISVFQLFNINIFTKNASAIEAAAKIDTIVWDKTGTLTQPKVSQVHLADNDLDEAKILQYAASVEKCFQHPLAEALIMKDTSIDILKCTNAKKSGQGVYGRVKEVEVWVGSLAHLQDHGVDVPQHLMDQESQYDANRMTSIYVGFGKKCVALIGLDNDVYEEAPAVINAAREKFGIDVILCTGDKRATALAQGARLNFTEQKILCEHQSPDGRWIRMDAEQKKIEIQKLQAKGRKVMMVGDGFNDMYAMEAADVSVAMGANSVASTMAKVAVCKPKDILKLILVSRATMDNILRNLTWTFAYNFISLIAAITLIFNPVVASICMACSSIYVVWNSGSLSPQIEELLEDFDSPNPVERTMLTRLKSHFKAMYRFGMSLLVVKNEAKKSLEPIPIPLNPIPNYMVEFNQTYRPSSPTIIKIEDDEDVPNIPVPEPEDRASRRAARMMSVAPREVIVID